MMLKELIAAILTGVLLSGCATQNVSFSSFPVGVKVVAGDQEGVTPCTLRVREDLTHATFYLPSGEKKEFPMPEMDTEIQETGEIIAKAAGGIIMGAGGIVGLAGAGLFLLGWVDLDDDDFHLNDSDSDDDSDAYAAIGVGLAGMGIGAGVILLGYWIYPDNATPVLHAELQPAEEAASTEGEDRYEDVGFGARRLKKAGP